MKGDFTSNVNERNNGLLKAENRIQKMQAFDALPEPVRIRLANAEFDISPTDALMVWQRYGTAITLMQIVKTEQRIKLHSRPYAGPPEESY